MKSKQRWLVAGLATTVGLGVIAPFATPYAVQATSGFPFNQEAKAHYEKVVPLVVKAEKTKSEKDVIAAYESFILITDKLNAEDLSSYKENNDLDKLYERLKKVMLGMPKSFQNKHIPLMANKWVEEVRKSLSSVSRYHLIDLIQSNKNEAIDKELRLVEKKLNFYNLVKDPSIPLPKGWDKSIDELYEDYKDTVDNSVTENPSNPPSMNFNPGSNGSGSNQKAPASQGAGTEFVQIGNVWYEVTYAYKDGKVTQTSKKKLTPQSHPQLYSQIGSYGSTGGSNSAKTFNLAISKEQFDYLTEDQNAESDYTIQYSLDKQSKNPYYFDTALRVDKDMNASYEQYKDVLYQIAVKSGGYVVEDNGRVLIVIDKKPIIVKDVKKAYSEKEIESLFEAFPNIDIRILKTRIGTSTSLEQQIVSKQAKTVKVNGKKVELASTPIVRDNRVLLPIKELGAALGAEVDQKEDKFVVTKDKDSVVYQLKSTKVVVKGKTVDIGIAPDVKDSVLYVEMSELSKAFGYELTWDSDDSELSFSKK